MGVSFRRDREEVAAVVSVVIAAAAAAVVVATAAVESRLGTIRRTGEPLAFRSGSFSRAIAASAVTKRQDSRRRNRKKLIVTKLFEITPGSSDLVGEC